MKLKALLICITLCVASLTFAQDDFQGVATYMSKTTMDMDGFGGKDMTPERKKAISERMKSMLEKTYVLIFNKSESTYKEDEKLDAPGSGGGFRGMMGSFTAGLQYKNIKDGQLIQDQEFFGKQFLIKDDLEKLEWKMTGETKQIGKYMAMKAVATKKVDAMDFSKMRRRGRDDDKKKDEAKAKGDRTVSTFGEGEAKEGGKENDSSALASTEEKSTDIMDEIDIPETEEVVAWYTMQIPVNNGPGDFWGLPGLILEINSGRTTILCSKIVMNPAEKQEIKMPTKGKEVTKAEYNDIVKKKMEEMREMYGGRNRGGHGGRH
ncbi:GLPGLI family protein [Lacinutrix sp. Bg11-31]|uniref:GLPGLI family protein n=1 Tax=Lacinutrix sp. Bg11-31 TaxID=2057808 RepID=UPI000C31147B|nr:GLPGLI family protein [Lacinutrix sp. Bg11-31]AUC83496.1 GLPGLI family protein [Lacinutrix sp. Bg11-31]